MKTIRIKLDHTHIKELLSGCEITAADVRGQEVNIIVSDDGVNVYRKVCSEALDEMEKSLNAWDK